MCGCIAVCCVLVVLPGVVCGGIARCCVWFLSYVADVFLRGQTERGEVVCVAVSWTNVPTLVGGQTTCEQHAYTTVTHTLLINCM